VFNLPKGEKDKLSSKDKTEIRNLKGKQSAPTIAKVYGVSHTMIYKIWKRNQMKPTIIDITIIQKLFGFFSNPLVRQSIPENTKQMFMVSLTEEEKNRIKIILGGTK
jgi:hypothetical protein